jgi:hypothetical protein
MTLRVESAQRRTTWSLCLVGQVRLGLRRRVVDLHVHDPLSGNGRKLLEGRSTAEEMPGIDEQPAVGAVGSPHDLPCGVQIRDAGPGEELDVGEQAVVGGDVAHPGETGSRRVDVHVDSVVLHHGDGSGADRSVKRAHGFGRVGSQHSRQGRIPGRGWLVAGEPRRHRVQLGDRQPVVGDPRPDVAVADTVGSQRVIVGRLHGHGCEAGRLGRAEAVEKRRRHH